MLFAPITSKKFQFEGSFDQDINNLSRLRSENPEKARELFERGESLVLMASRGEMRKIRSYIDTTEDDTVPTFFVHKMFVESLCNGHLIMASYIIDNGFPHNSYQIPSPIHICFERVEDLQAVSILQFMLSKDFDINRQQKYTWLSLLHIAVRRALKNTIAVLLEHGADVNIVAKDDVMPLQLAESISSLSDVKEDIIAMLKQRGAKSTWRQDIPSSAATKSILKETKMVSFSGGRARKPLQLSERMDIDTMTMNDGKDKEGRADDEEGDCDDKSSFQYSSDGGMMFSAS